MAIGTLDTFPKLLMHHAQVRGGRPAIREKDLGIWQTWTWKRFADEVRALACGLAAEGFKRGDHLALVGDNRPRIYAAVCAAQCLGGIPVPLYQDAQASELVFPIRNAEIRFAIAEDQEQVDKLLEILPQCPTLARIFYDDARGMRRYSQPQLAQLRETAAGGRRLPIPGLSMRKSTRAAARTPRRCSSPRAPPACPRAWFSRTTRSSTARARWRRWSGSPSATWCSLSCRPLGSARTSSPTPSRSSPATASAARSRPRR